MDAKTKRNVDAEKGGQSLLSKFMNGTAFYFRGKWPWW